MAERQNGPTFAIGGWPILEDIEFTSEENPSDTKTLRDWFNNDGT